MNESLSKTLVVDAGSTKIHWKSLDSGAPLITTKGWNPSQDANPLHFDDSELLEALHKTEKLIFYGTGTKSSYAQIRLQKTFQPFDLELEIHSDLIGAARALFGHSEGIVVILGTGSNVAYYDGKEISLLTPSLGYLLGDEGSGNAIGKAILRDFMYKEMPVELRDQFERQYNVNLEIVLEALYQKDRPNAYLAQFPKFLSKINSPWKDQLLKNEFNELVEKRILKHKNFLSVQIGFVGSTAFYFSNSLQTVCNSYQINNFKILREPILALVEYHRNSI